MLTVPESEMSAYNAQLERAYRVIAEAAGEGLSRVAVSKALKAAVYDRDAGCRVPNRCYEALRWQLKQDGYLFVVDFRRGEEGERVEYIDWRSPERP